MLRTRLGSRYLSLFLRAMKLRGSVLESASPQDVRGLFEACGYLKTPCADLVASAEPLTLASSCRRSLGRDAKRCERWENSNC